MRIPATTARKATNSVVLNAALVSVERRRTWLGRPEPNGQGAALRTAGRGALVALIGTPLDVRKADRTFTREAEMICVGAVPIWCCWSTRKLSSACSSLFYPTASSPKHGSFRSATRARRGLSSAGCLRMGPRTPASPELTLQARRLAGGGQNDEGSLRSRTNARQDLHLRRIRVLRDERWHDPRRGDDDPRRRA